MPCVNGLGKEVGIEPGSRAGGVQLPDHGSLGHRRR
jgi:hypothetical protein